MARQPTNPERVKAAMAYYVSIVKLFKRGALDGKVTTLMKAKCKELRIGFSTFYEKIKK